MCTLQVCLDEDNEMEMWAPKTGGCGVRAMERAFSGLSPQSVKINGCLKIEKAIDRLLVCWSALFSMSVTRNKKRSWFVDNGVQTPHMCARVVIMYLIMMTKITTTKKVVKPLG